MAELAQEQEFLFQETCVFPVVGENRSVDILEKGFDLAYKSQPVLKVLHQKSLVYKTPSTTATVLSLSKKTISDIGPDAMWYLDTAEIGDSQFAVLLFDKRKKHWSVKYMSQCHYYDKSFGQRDTQTPTQLGFHEPAFFLKHSDEYTPQRYAKSIALSSDPEVEEFVILGSDGLWKCFGNEGMYQTKEMQAEQELLILVKKAHRSWQESSYIPDENFVSWLGKDIRNFCDACDITQSNDDRVFLLASICTRSMAKGCPRQDFVRKNAVKFTQHDHYVSDELYEGIVLEEIVPLGRKRFRENSQGDLTECRVVSAKKDSDSRALFQAGALERGLFSQKTNIFKTKFCKHGPDCKRDHSKCKFAHSFNELNCLDFFGFGADGCKNYCKSTGKCPNGSHVERH